MSYAAEKLLVDRAEAAIVHAAATAGSNDYTPMLPFELVEATEHHGPYIATAFGTTVCDFYAMSDPSAWSVRNGGTSRPIPFTDAADNAAFMVRAANGYQELLTALREVVHEGLIYWEPATSRGVVQKADMMGRMVELLDRQGARQ